MIGSPTSVGNGYADWDLARLAFDADPTILDDIVSFHPEYCIYDFNCPNGCAGGGFTTDYLDFIYSQSPTPDYQDAAGDVINFNPLFNPVNSTPNTNIATPGLYQPIDTYIHAPGVSVAPNGYSDPIYSGQHATVRDCLTL